MKIKSLFFLAAFFLNANLFSQTIPNAGFENWTTTTYADPDNWGTLNATTFPLGATTVDQASPGFSGNYFIQIATKNIPPMGIVPGYAVTGNIDPVTYAASGGFPISVRPASITGMCQYMAGSLTDYATIVVFLSKWNTTTGIRDTISYTKYLFLGMEMAWISFDIPLLYQSPLTPDTALIILGASFDHPAAFSYLWVDDIAFSGIESTIENESYQNSLTIFPNPSNGYLNLMCHADQISNVTIQLIDLCGKICLEKNVGCEIGENQIRFDLEGIENGIYFIHFQTEKTVKTEKIIIEY